MACSEQRGWQREYEQVVAHARAQLRRERRENVTRWDASRVANFRSRLGARRVPHVWRVPGHGSLDRARSPKGIANHPTRFGQLHPIAVGKDLVAVGERQREPIGKSKHIDRHRQLTYP